MSSSRGSRMRRRDFIAGAISVAAAPRAFAQTGASSRRLAIFSPSESAALMREHGENRYYRVLFAELRRLGHVEGQNLTVERYGRKQNISGLDALVAAVVRSNPDVVYAIGPGAVNFKNATTAVAVVALVADPVALGLAATLAHPGGNITGVSVDTGPSIHGKRIALLREMFPAMSKLACLTLRLQWEGIQGPVMRAACPAVRTALR